MRQKYRPETKSQGVPLGSLVADGELGFFADGDEITFIEGELEWVRVFGTLVWMEVKAAPRAHRECASSGVIFARSKAEAGEIAALLSHGKPVEIDVAKTNGLIFDPDLDLGDFGITVMGTERLPGPVRARVEAFFEELKDADLFPMANRGVVLPRPAVGGLGRRAF